MEPIPRFCRFRFQDSCFPFWASPAPYSLTAALPPGSLACHTSDDHHSPASFIAAWYLSASCPSTATCW